MVSALSTLRSIIVYLPFLFISAAVFVLASSVDSLASPLVLPAIHLAPVAVSEELALSGHYEAPS